MTEREREGFFWGLIARREGQFLLARGVGGFPGNGSRKSSFMFCKVLDNFCRIEYIYFCRFGYIYFCRFEYIYFIDLDIFVELDHVCEH